MFGIAFESMVPMRANASDASEMVSQLLFGEAFSVLEKEKNWMLIRSETDLYEGWVDPKMVLLFENDTAYAEVKAQLKVRQSACRLIPEGVGYEIHIPPGSFLPALETFKLADTYFLAADSSAYKEVDIFEAVNYFLGAPYLWGGKTKGGIDCSGFTQIVHRITGKFIPRDAGQQSEEQGDIIEFLSESQPGDLAFFDNEEGKITHTGIILNNNIIAHASGRVRTDRIDQEGIYNSGLKKYTHKLRLIKRLR